MTPEPKLFPQEPRGRLVRINRPLLYPAIDPLSPLAVRGAVDTRVWQKCCLSSEASLERFCKALESVYPAVSSDYPGFHDELSNHLRVDGLPTSDAMLEKLTAEFRAYCGEHWCQARSWHRRFHDPEASLSRSVSGAAARASPMQAQAVRSLHKPSRRRPTHCPPRSQAAPRERRRSFPEWPRWTRWTGVARR